jgi:hypothetical protein
MKAMDPMKVDKGIVDAWLGIFEKTGEAYTREMKRDGGMSCGDVRRYEAETRMGWVWGSDWKIEWVPRGVY